MSMEEQKNKAGDSSAQCGNTNAQGGDKRRSVIFGTTQRTTPEVAASDAVRRTGLCQPVMTKGTRTSTGQRGVGGAPSRSTLSSSGTLPKPLPSIALLRGSLKTSSARPMGAVGKSGRVNESDRRRARRETWHNPKLAAELRNERRDRRVPLLPRLAALGTLVLRRGAEVAAGLS